MRRKMLCTATLATMMLVVGASVSADVKRIAYPPIKVELTAAYTPDAAFNSFRTEFIDAVARRDAKALLALVAPGFLWTVNNNLSPDFDPGRDPQHNFRVVFGFRALGGNVDGEVENGPYWDNLAAFANESTYYQSTDGRKLICSPVAASIVDEELFKQVRAKIETPGEGADWYFIVRSTAVTPAPGDKGTPIATIGLEAVPILSSYPLADSGLALTHYEILLPSGRVGWIPVDAARPFQADQLCYALTANGEWKIAIYDSAE
jgi:hypothetical protein